MKNSVFLASFCLLSTVFLFSSEYQYMPPTIVRLEKMYNQLKKELDDFTRNYVHQAKSPAQQISAWHLIKDRFNEFLEQFDQALQIASGLNQRHLVQQTLLNAQRDYGRIERLMNKKMHYGEDEIG